MRSLTIVALSLALSSCALFTSEPPLPPPPPVITAPPPAPKIVVEQVCIHIDDWAPGAQADAEATLAASAHVNPNVAHLIMEWSRLRSDAKACVVAQK
jgi:hypothetical protein